MSKCCAGGGGRAAAPACCAAPAVPAVAPRVTADLTPADRLGALRVRLGFGRDRYRVAPGLYALGAPAAESPVLVTANYKLSFDTLRANLPGRDAWLLVLETRGINVWCAAGKGTFGTDELCARLAAVGLAARVSHRRLIVPQLGASGIAAHEVQRRTGFVVAYGPVRARDLPAYLAADNRATAGMREVQFTLRDRVTLIPVEINIGARYLGYALVVLVVLSGLHAGGYAFTRAAALESAAGVLAAFFAGTMLTPILLPYLPHRAFALKGAWCGALAAALFSGFAALPFSATMAWLLMIMAFSSFLALNFTGATPLTSPAGVLREMRLALPLQGLALLAGMMIWLLARVRP